MVAIGERTAPPFKSVGMQIGKQAVCKTVALWSVVGSSPILPTNKDGSANYTCNSFKVKHFLSKKKQRFDSVYKIPVL